MLTRTGEREIGAVSWRLPDIPGKLACIETFTYQDVKDLKNWITYDHYSSLSPSSSVTYLPFRHARQNFETIYDRGSNYVVM